jgi:hypothetical protein
VPSLQVAYVWHASVFTREVLNGLLRIGFLYPQQIIWNKGRVVLTRTHYWYQHEPCWYVRKKNASWFGKPGENSTVWDSPSPKFIMGGSGEEKYDHPTQKPVELMRRPILNHTKRGEVVYDAFLGSGTTLAAAESTGRVCQPVIFISSIMVTPSGRFSKSSTLAVLLPSRAALPSAALAFFWPLGAFFAGVAFLLAFGFFGATWAPFLATAAFLLGFGLLAFAFVGFGWSPAWAAPVSTVIEVSMLSPLAVITAVVTWITPVRTKSKAILTGIDRGEGSAMYSDWSGRLGQIAADEGPRRKIRTEEGRGDRRVANAAHCGGGGARRRASVRTRC